MEEEQRLASMHHDSVIRWRKNDNDKKESNTRVVRWNDGSLQLFVGDEVFDIAQQDMMNADNVHLYAKVCEYFYN